MTTFCKWSYAYVRLFYPDFAQDHFIKFIVELDGGIWDILGS